MTCERSQTPEESLLADFLELQTPEGYRAELIEGEFVVSPPPDGDHESIISLVVTQVIRNSATDMHFSGHKGLVVPGTKGAPDEHLIPDVTFAVAENWAFRDAPSWMRCEGIAMVVEVTSPGSHPRDRGPKRRAYARGGIPLYLLVDRSAGEVALFSHPEKGDYTDTHTTLLGKALDLPAPFSFPLDTADF
jgi:Uma2 family endonuclease